MELKRVSEVTSKEYAKKDEISKRKIKQFTPVKWLSASAAGIVTLLYTSPRNSIHKIGVVFGCISIEGAESYNYSSLWHVTNSVMDVFYYLSWILGVAFVFILGHHMINKKNYDEEKRLKSVKRIKIFATILIISIIITALLVVFLKLDISAFYTNGVKELTNSNPTDSMLKTNGF